jgi:predicted dehydrogenase
VIGYGIGKLHATSFRYLSTFYPHLPVVELAAVATASEASGREAVAQMGFKRWTTDYRELVAADDIDGLVVAVPNHLHYEIIAAALETRKALFLDKPLTLNLNEAYSLYDQARARGRDAQMIFQFRYCPAVRRAYELVRGGQLGEVRAFRWRHYRPSYVNPEKPLRWKGSLALSGGGVIPDLGAHSMDLLIWMLGVPDRLSAQGRTFVSERPVADGSTERVRVETEDHAILHLAMTNGAIGTLEVCRMVPGAVNELGFHIIGSRGSVQWDAMEPNYLLYHGEDLAQKGGMLKIPVPTRFPGATLPGPDFNVGTMEFYTAAASDFLTRTVEGKPYDPGLVQGVRVQALIETAMQSTRQDGGWLSVPDITQTEAHD